MSGERVLVVEDDVAASRILKLVLGRDFEVIQAFTRSDALKNVSVQSPHLVVMDYRMPGPPAEEFIDSLRGQGFTGPIVLCTGMTEPTGLNVDAVVIKPYDPDDMVRTVAHALSSLSR